MTSVAPGRRYRVAPAAHPVYERWRVETFRDLLLTRSGETDRRRLGELMYRIARELWPLRSRVEGTDRLVALVRAQGPAAGLYGARITGGGSGGTVAVLGRPDAAPAVARVADAYERQTGYRPQVFAGSSPGVSAFGGRSIVV